MASDVRTCRRCGRVFEDKRLKPYKMPTSDEGYVEHRYCPSCGGHGDILAEGPIAR